MTPSDPPGMRLHRFLARWCREDTMREIVDPSLGDMQREAHAALNRPGRRRLIVLSGHAGVVRAVVMNRVLAADFLVPAGGLLLLGLLVSRRAGGRLPHVPAWGQRRF